MARKLVLMTAVGALLTVWAGAATAAPVTVLCPSPIPTGAVRQFSLTTDPAGSTCLAWGSGSNDVNGAGDVINALGWMTLDKDESPDTSYPMDSWFSVSGLGSTSGTITINPAAWATYGSLAVAFKVGSGDPTWAAFILPAGETEGRWTTNLQQGGGLSHATFYGQGTPVVPEPASMVLLGSGLLGLAAKARRRQKK